MIPDRHDKSGARGKPGDFTTHPRVLLLMALAAVIGALATLTAWLLLKLIALCTNLAYGLVPSFAANPPDLRHGVAFLIAVPAVGGLIIGLMARYGSEKIRGHGIPEAIEAILIGKSRIGPRVAILKPLSSAISIGTGGPFGAEGPIIMTGGAVGSILAQAFHLSSSERKSLLVAGAAAGMTAIFASPLAAVLLAVELLLFEWKPRSFLPVLVGVTVAATLRPMILEVGPLFPFAGLSQPGALALAAWVGLGIACGLCSGLLTAMVYGSEDAFQKLPIHWMWWPMIGGVAVGIGGIVQPAALGVGYDNIRLLLTGHASLAFVASLLAVKAVIWAIALGSGTSGGVLAPLLIFGGCLGALLGHVLPAADPGFWALLGMAAMMGGTMRAPLTATLFAVELTGDWQAMLPLLAASGMAFATTVLLLKRSILTEKIARRGLHISREYHADPFEQTWVKDVMVRDVDTLPADITVAEALAFFLAPVHRHKSYPLVDGAGRLAGLVSRGDILTWSTDTELGPEAVVDILPAGAILEGHPEETVRTLADRMAVQGVGRVPIVDAEGKLIGLVARKDLLAARAKSFIEERDHASLIGRKPTKIASPAARA